MLILLLQLTCLGETGAPPGQRILENAIQPQLAIAADRSVYVVALVEGNVSVCHSTDGGRTFSPPRLAIDAGGKAQGGKQRGPRIGVAAGKKVVVTAPLTFDPEEQARRYPTNDLYYAASGDGGKTWSSPLRLNREVKKAPEALHWLAVEGDGTAHVAWLDLRGRTTPGQDLYYVKVSPAGVPGEDRRIAQGVCECCAPGLGVDAAGRAYLAWRDGTQGTPSREILQILAPPTGTPGVPARVNKLATRIAVCPMSAPAVAVRADGASAVTAWMDEQDGAGARRVRWVLGPWGKAGAERPASSLPGGQQDHPSATVDASGVAWLAWEEKTASGARSVWARRLDESSPPWQASDPQSEPAAYPVLATGGGLVALVYESRKAGDGVVFRRIHEAGTADQGR